jgi:hypothetical protein
MANDVDPHAYGNASDKMVQLAAAVLKGGGIGAAISGQSGMAGSASDDAAKAFADGYDKAAPQALTAINNVAGTCFSAAGLLWTTGDNYAQADADSTPGGGHKDYPYVEPEGNDSWPPNSPSVLGAGGQDGPDGFIGEIWRLVEQFVNHVWPNGHQDRLRSVGEAWLTASRDLGGHQNDVVAITGMIGQQDSPEIPIATARIKAIGEDLDAVSKACDDLGKSCNDYAQHIDDAHADLISALEEMAVEAAAWEAGGVLLTEVGGELWANLAIAGRLVEWGNRLKTIIEGFIALVRTVGGKLVELLGRLAAILLRTGPKVVPGTSRVGEDAVENALRDLLKKSVNDYDNQIIKPGPGQRRQLADNYAKWNRNVKGNVIDKDMKQRILNDPFLNQHLTVTPRGLPGPDIVVTNPGPGGPDWYDITTTRMGDQHLQDYANWGIGKILEWDAI